MKCMFWTVLGFIGGVIVAQNSGGMNTPSVAAVFLTMIVSCGFMFTLGFRGKSIAVATAVATANATAEANAQAIATNAVNLYMGHQNGVTPELIKSFTTQTIDEEHQNELSNEYDFSHDSSVGNLSQYEESEHFFDDYTDGVFGPYVDRD